MSVATSALTLAPPASARRQSREAGWFVPATVAICIFLQRFGLPFGNLAINVVGPLGLAFAGWGLATGRLAIHRGRLLMFTCLVGLILLGSYVAASAPDPFFGVNVYSTLQYVGISSFAILTFAQPMGELAFSRQVNRFLSILAVAGIVQFLAQFAGVAVFSFAGFVPASVLAETNWNLEIPIGVGELLKSNGFFLVEPSVMSQFMAVALMIEVLGLRRPRHLLTFAAAFMLSFSGTGGLVLGLFVAVIAVRLGWRGLMAAAAMLVGAALVAGALMLIQPDLAAVVTSRFNEFNQPGTSGHMRFVTPFWLLSDMLHRAPGLALFGLGGGVSEHLVMPYDYDVNTPVKITLEYGFPALACYLLLFLVGKRSKLQSVLVLPGFGLLMFTGGYQQFAPLIFFVALVCCVARLEPDGQLSDEWR